MDDKRCLDDGHHDQNRQVRVDGDREEILYDGQDGEVFPHGMIQEVRFLYQFSGPFGPHAEAQTADVILASAKYYLV